MFASSEKSAWQILSVQNTFSHQFKSFLLPRAISSSLIAERGPHIPLLLTEPSTYVAPTYLPPCKQYVNHELPDVQAGFRKGQIIAQEQASETPPAPSHAKEIIFDFFGQHPSYQVHPKLRFACNGYLKPNLQ